MKYNSHSTERRIGTFLQVLLCLLLAIALLPVASPLASAEAAETTTVSDDSTYGFSDVDGTEWFANAQYLGYVVEKGLMKGYDDSGAFGPYDIITRGQVAVVLHRLAGGSHADASDFSDVDYSEYYGNAIEWARSTGVIKGYGDTNTFGPNDPVTREQLAVMLCNYAEKVAGVDIGSDGSKLAAMPDADEVDDWGVPAVSWVMDQGIISGVVEPDGAFVRPLANAQRCQFAKMASVFHRDVLKSAFGAGEGGTVAFKDDVLVANSAEWSASADGANVSVSASSLPGGVKVGDVVALMPTAENPSGGSMVVRSIENGTAVGEPAELAQLIEQLDVSGSKEGAAGFEPAEGVEVVEDISLADLEDSADLGKIKVKVKMPESSGISGSVSLDLKPKVEYSVKGGADNLDLYLGFGCESKAQAKIEVKSEKLSDDASIPLGKYSVPTSAPGVTTSITLYLVVDVKGSVSVVVSDDVTAGVRYKSGWSAPKFETGSKPSMDGVELSGSYDGGVDLSYAVNMLGCPVVDGSFGGGASIEGKATFRPTGMVCVEAELGPYCSLAAGKHSWVGDLFGLSFEKKFKGAMSKVHFENGSFVSKCTWNEEATDPDTPGGGGGSDGSDPDAPGGGGSDGSDPGASGGEPSPASDFEYQVGDFYANGQVLSGSPVEWVEGKGYRYVPGYGCRFGAAEAQSAEPVSLLGDDAVEASDAEGYNAGHGVYITGYKGESDSVVVPKSIDGLDVVLVDFDVSGNSFQGRESSTVDVSRCTSLKALMGYWGIICEKAVFGTLPSLQNVDIRGNSFRSNVDLSGVANLEDLRLSCINLYGLTMGAAPSNLRYVQVKNPDGLTGPDTLQFDLSNCSALEYAQLPCGDVEVRMGDNPLLKTLSCPSCGLTSLDVSGCPNLESLDCSQNGLTSLDVSGCPTLRSLDCDSNGLTSLALSGCPNLESLHCSYNDLSSLDVSGCPNLKSLHCDENGLTSLALSGCPTLRWLDCDSNGLTSLDVSGCPNLELVHCSYNDLSSLDVSGCPNLEWIYCSHNGLTSLDVSGCPNLESLDCSHNGLTFLDVSGCPNLESLDCQYNDLTSLDISGCPSLESLDCSQNRISDTSALEAWLAVPGHSGRVNPQKSDEESLAA